jgi:RNA polymerase sigma factor (sigma-70 family)
VVRRIFAAEGSEEMTSESMISVFQEESDSTLVTATKKGKRQAFESLVKRHEAMTFSLVFRLTRNREDAQDVVQQSFHKVFMPLDRCQGKSSFSTWLTRSVINEALMCLRRKRTLREISLEDAKSEPEGVFPMEIPDQGENPSELYEQLERERILFQAMDHLSAEFRTVLRFQLEDLSVGEMAEILGLGISTLKARLFRAPQKLRVLFTRGPELRRRPAIGRGQKREGGRVNSHPVISSVSCGWRHESRLSCCRN